MIRVGHFNAHSMDSEKQYLVCESMRRMKLDFVGVSETWKMVKDDEYLKRIHGYSVKGFSDPSGRRGLAVFVNPQLKFRYLSEFSVRTDEYHMVTLQHRRLIVVQVYCPHGMNNSGLKEVVDKLDSLAEIYEDVVVCGDLNARMGLVESEGFNANGKLLRQWLKESKFFRVQLNGRFV